MISVVKPYLRKEESAHLRWLLGVPWGMFYKEKLVHSKMYAVEGTLVEMTQTEFSTSMELRVEELREYNKWLRSLL